MVLMTSKKIGLYPLIYTELKSLFKNLFNTIHFKIGRRLRPLNLVEGQYHLFTPTVRLALSINGGESIMDLSCIIQILG